MQKQLRRYLLLVLCIGLLLATAFGTAHAETSTLDQVKQLLQAFYVREVPSHVLNASSIEELLEGLNDPYTDYFTAEEYQEFLNGINMEFSGLGIYIDAQPEGIVVLSVIEGTPAEEVGLKPGDIIIEADGVSLVDSSNEEAVSLLRGPEGSQVSIKVLRDGQVLEFKVTRRTVHVPTVTSELLDGHIGYLDIDSFGIDTYQLLRQKIEDLRKQGAEAWIVDLRNNSGGYLSTAWQIAGLFIDDKLVVRWLERNATYLYNGLPHENLVEEPVIVLTNQYSASAAEILAAALKDHKAATLVGTVTYGKGSGQSMFRLFNGDVLKLTVAEFRSPNGNIINEVGVTPHIDTGEADPLPVARLLLQGIKRPHDYTGYYKLETPAHDFYISVDMARSADYWQGWRVLFEKAPDDSLYFFVQGTWQEVELDDRTVLEKAYYPECFVLKKRMNLSPRTRFLILLPEEKTALLPNHQEITLVNAATGEPVPVRIELCSSGIKVVPKDDFLAGNAYWLVIHEGLFHKTMVLPVQVK